MNIFIPKSARFIDMTGTKYDRLTVIGYAGKTKSHRWTCRCDCGKELVVQTGNLRSGHTKSCGCHRLDPEKHENLSGHVFERLTVIRESVKSVPGKRMWDCVCSCGEALVVRGTNLKSGNSNSCGCYANEIRGQAAKTHGLTDSKEYAVWTSVLARCRNPNVKCAEGYSGRGITICERWTGPTGFSNFLQDMGKVPEGLTIERKDNNGPYSLDNCRWATQMEQANNRRSNRIVNYLGRNQTLAQWCREVGVKYSLARERLDRGWTPEMAFNK